MSAVKKTTPSKDTIYIDVEDEITAIIDKMSKSDSKVVALVLPKRAATMQSVVNLKLLKRAAASANKSIALITSDPSVLPLAGVVGLHVAKTLQSKPAIPTIPKVDDEAITVDSDVEGGDVAEDPKLDPKAPIGALAGDDETIDVDENAGAKALAASAGKKDKNRKLSVPNFDSFRTKLIIGTALLVLLIGGWVLAALILPKATITISTDTTQVNTSLSLEAKADTTADLDKNIVPAIKKELKQSSIEKVPTTGKRDDGAKATGTMTIFNCSADTVVLPTGTIFTSGLSFVSDKEVSVPKSSYSLTPGGFVCDKNVSKSVAVTAQNGGASYNLSARPYQIQNAPTNVTASGSDMAGGTSKLVSIVSQSDIDGAKQQALDKLMQPSSQELRKQFSAEQLLGIEGTLENAAPTTVASPEVGQEGTEVVVTVNVTYVMYGVKRDILTQAIEKEVKEKIDFSKQVVQNTGLDAADIRVTDKPAPGIFKLNLQTTATAGPQLDVEGIKKDVAGKKRRLTQETVAARPGVTDVKVSYSPFWVVQTPKKTSKITIIFVQTNVEKK